MAQGIRVLLAGETKARKYMVQAPVSLRNHHLSLTVDWLYVRCVDSRICAIPSPYKYEKVEVQLHQQQDIWSQKALCAWSKQGKWKNFCLNPLHFICVPKWTERVYQTQDKDIRWNGWRMKIIKHSVAKRNNFNFYCSVGLWGKMNTVTHTHEPLDKKAFFR